MYTHNVYDMRDLRNKWYILNENFKMKEQEKQKKKDELINKIDKFIDDKLREGEGATQSGDIASYPRRIGDSKVKGRATKKSTKKKICSSKCSLKKGKRINEMIYELIKSVRLMESAIKR